MTIRPIQYSSRDEVTQKVGYGGLLTGTLANNIADIAFIVLYYPVSFSAISFYCLNPTGGYTGQVIRFALYSMDASTRLISLEFPASVGVHTLSIAGDLQAGGYWTGLTTDAPLADGVRLRICRDTYTWPIYDHPPAGKPPLGGWLAIIGGVLPDSFNPLDLAPPGAGYAALIRFN